MATICPKCRFENPDDTNFCGKCATPLSGMSDEALGAAKKYTGKISEELAIGTLIAAKYRILAKLGAGGMGEVYRAEDLSLNRQVAVKVLPEVFASDPERLARFEREARVLAALNHPNIAAIYGVEEGDGRRFLILELVEGETLAERLIRGALTLEETLDVCGQIAAGLEGAHEKGILHRDLKPANVKITPEGKAKILDFGLARPFRDQISEVDISKSPTITAGMTRPGVILGTAAYMSPEQAKGAAVDKRADIWAYGCILYECLTGKRAFPGDTVTETIAAILKAEPDLESLPKDVPANIRGVIGRCLEKDRDLRYRDVADAWLEIKAPAAYPSATITAPRRPSLLWLAAGAVVIFLAGILVERFLFKRPQSAASPSVVASIIKVEPGHWLDGMRRSVTMERPNCPAMAISNDGSFVVYCAVEDNPVPQAKSQLYLRKLNQAQARPIAGTEAGIHPFLSPDNRWVGFWADKKLKKVPVEGGVPADICDAQGIYGANWGRDNIIIFADHMDRGLSSVSADGGKPEILTTPDPKREEVSHRLPFWLKNGKAALFTVMKHRFDTQPGIALLDLDRREWNILLQDASDARYVPTGHLVFLRQGKLLAVRFDLDNLDVIGQPFPLMESISQGFNNYDAYNTGAGQFSISDTGTLVYAAGGVAPPLNNTLVWVDQRGIEQPATSLPLPPGIYTPRLSPEGRRIGYAASESRVWVYDMDRNNNRPLTSEGVAIVVIWAPDGKRLLFSWLKSLAFNLFWVPCDGSLPMDRLTKSEFEQRPGSWSSDGKTVALVETHPDTGFDIALLDVLSRRVTPFLNSPFNEMFPEFSSDGRWIAYSSDESKRDEVYVCSFPGPGMKIQVSNEGGVQPLWARKDKRLFYRRRNQVWMVDVLVENGFSTTRPRLLFEKSGYNVGIPIRSYDLSLDGQRFLMVKLEDRKPSPITEMTLIQNWFEELKRLDPSGKK